MPCRVDLFEGYSWYDHTDLAAHMYYNTPLVPLMCEVMKLVESRGLIKECSPIVQKWYEYHKEDDIHREKYGKKLPWSNKKEELVPFVEHMNSIGFTAEEGILTSVEKEEKDKKWAEKMKQLEEDSKKYDEENKKKQERWNREQDAVKQAQKNIEEMVKEKAIKLWGNKPYTITSEYLVDKPEEYIQVYKADGIEVMRVKSPVILEVDGEIVVNIEIL